MPTEWNDVPVADHYFDGKELSESGFILYDPVNIDGVESQRVIHVIADDYRYWDVKYYLIDVAGSRCLDIDSGITIMVWMMCLMQFRLISSVLKFLHYLFNA